MNKSLTTVGNRLSRAEMKSIVGGYGTNICPYDCRCEGGARPLVFPGYEIDMGCSGPVCYCPDDTRIYGANCPCL